MTQSTPSPTAFRAWEAPDSVLENPAIARCCQAWSNAFQAEMEEYIDEFGNEPEEGSFPEVFATRAANKAYCKAMPPLSGYQNICDFIACAAHGLLIEAINETIGTAIIHAARVALRCVSRQPENRDPAK